MYAKHVGKCVFDMHDVQDGYFAEQMGGGVTT